MAPISAEYAPKLVYGAIRFSFVCSSYIIADLARRWLEIDVLWHRENYLQSNPSITNYSRVYALKILQRNFKQDQKLLSPSDISKREHNVNVDW